jgi:hypothetical protein
MDRLHGSSSDSMTISNSEGPLDDGSADRSQDRDDPLDQRYDRPVAALQRS